MTSRFSSVFRGLRWGEHLSRRAAAGGMKPETRRLQQVFGGEQILGPGGAGGQADIDDPAEGFLADGRAGDAAEGLPSGFNDGGRAWGNAALGEQREVAGADLFEIGGEFVAAGAVGELQGDEFGTEEIGCPVLVMHGVGESTEAAKAGRAWRVPCWSENLYSE